MIRPDKISVDDPRLYKVWATMLQRCSNPNRDSYKNYGGRGITVCEEWKRPGVFAEWAYRTGYVRGLQIDRINNEEGYSPDNCRWVSAKENARNKRTNVWLTINGETRCVRDWADELGVNRYTIYWWISTYCEEYAIKRIEAELIRKKCCGAPYKEE